MAREEYGITWWGEQWLQALTKIDNANRIPRGKTYARKGSVASLEINKNNIAGKVKGSRPKPYTVKLSMKEISNAEHDVLLLKIASYPSIISKLQNGKIDPQLLAICNEENIKIFPAKASDMNMSCSCPDYAVPCKHIAAVLYKVCSEIDNDPFILFKFRNLDLFKNIRQLTVDNSPDIASEDAFYVKHYKKAKHKIDELQIIDYSKLPDKKMQVIELLEAQPPFYNKGDFKKNYNDTLFRIAKQADSKLNESDTISETENNESTKKINYENTLQWKWHKHKIDQGGFTIDAILGFTPYELNLLDQNIRYAQDWCKLSLHLISKGLIYPKIIQDSDSFYIYWHPLILDKNLNQIISKSHQPFSISVNNHPTDSFLTLSFLITEFITSLYSNSKKDTDETIDFFFGHEKRNFNGLSEKGIPKNIAHWLKIFEWDMGQFIPVIQVNEEKEDNFSVDLRIKDFKNDNGSLFMYADYIKKKNKTNLSICIKTSTC